MCQHGYMALPSDAYPSCRRLEVTDPDAPCMATAVACSRRSRFPRHPRARKHTHAVVIKPRGIDRAAMANVCRVLMPEDRSLSCRRQCRQTRVWSGWHGLM